MMWISYVVLDPGGANQIIRTLLLLLQAFFDDHFGEWLGSKAPVHWVLEPKSLSFWKKCLSFEGSPWVLRKMLEFLENIRWVLEFWEISPEFCVSPGKCCIYKILKVQKSEKDAVWTFNILSFWTTLGSKATVRWIFGQILAKVFFLLEFFSPWVFEILSKNAYGLSASKSTFRYELCPVRHLHWVPPP